MLARRRDRAGVWVGGGYSRQTGSQRSWIFLVGLMLKLFLEHIRRFSFFLSFSSFLFFYEATNLHVYITRHSATTENNIVTQYLILRRNNPKKRKNTKKQDKKSTNPLPPKKYIFTLSPSPNLPFTLRQIPPSPDMIESLPLLQHS